MEYGLNINYLTKKISMEKAAGLVSNAGFTALDYNPDCTIDGWENEIEKNMKIFQKEKLRVHQTHAPFNRYSQYDESFRKYVWNTLEATKMMGAEYIVVHGDEFDFKNLTYSPEAALEYNYNFYAPIVEKAISYGIKIAFENVFEDDISKLGNPRFCSKSEDLKALIEKFNSENVCCCWDFGHAGVAFEKNQPEKILELGKYIECTHVHDCDHGYDTHLPPFMGEIDWTACMKAMNKIGYSGIINFEMVYGSIPEEAGAEFISFLKKTAEYLNSNL